METSQNVSGSEIKNFLTRRLGEKEADEMMLYIDSEIQKEVSVQVDTSKKEITMWREEMQTIFATKAEANELGHKLIKRVSKAEGTLILWAFVFWLTQLIAVLCFLKFYK